MENKRIKVTVLNVNVTNYPFFLNLQNTKDLKLVLTHQYYKAV